MLRVESNTKLEGFTEYEEEILFDSDDPDFPPPISKVPIILTVRGNMSIASVHPAEIHSNHSSLTTLSHSLEDIASTSWGSSPIPYSDHVLTIEELRLQMTTCFTCGVSWNDSHVSLDCSECGGYALERPCLECDGKCGAMWKRDLSMSHASGKARWEGICSLKPPQQPISAPPQQQQQQQQQKVTDASQELATKLEKLSANS